MRGPYVAVDRGLPRDARTLLLARLLEIAPTGVCGHLAMLWTWALDNAPSGDLAPFQDAVIADAAMWDGDDGRFVRCLKTAGFVDDALHLAEWDQLTAPWRAEEEAIG